MSFHCLTDMCVGHKSSSVASKASSVTTKAPTVPPVASSAVATDASSITVTVRHAGELVAVVEPVAVGVGEVSVGVAIREAVSLGNTHDTQTPKLVYRRKQRKLLSQLRFTCFQPDEDKHILSACAKKDFVFKPFMWIITVIQTQIKALWIYSVHTCSMFPGIAECTKAIEPCNKF